MERPPKYLQMISGTSKNCTFCAFHTTVHYDTDQNNVPYKKKISINNIFLEKLRFTFFLREKWLVDFSIRRHRQTSPHMQQISSAEIFFFFKLEIKYTCLEHLYIFIFRLKTRHTLKKKLKSIGVVRVSRSLSRIYIRFEFSMIF